MAAKEQGQWCRDMGLSVRSMRKAAAILDQLQGHVAALQRSASSGVNHLIKAPLLQEPA